MNEEVRLCVHCGEEIVIRTESGGRLIKCDVKKISVMDDAGQIRRLWRPHFATCERQLEDKKAVDDGGS
jgi:hypothetical protein